MTWDVRQCKQCPVTWECRLCTQTASHSFKFRHTHKHQHPLTHTQGTHILPVSEWDRPLLLPIIRFTRPFSLLAVVFGTKQRCPAPFDQHCALFAARRPWHSAPSSGPMKRVTKQTFHTKSCLLPSTTAVAACRAKVTCLRESSGFRNGEKK